MYNEDAWCYSFKVYCFLTLLWFIHTCMNESGSHNIKWNLSIYSSKAENLFFWYISFLLLSRLPLWEIQEFPEKSNLGQTHGKAAAIGKLVHGHALHIIYENNKSILFYIKAYHFPLSSIICKFLCACSYLERHLFHFDLDIWFGIISIFFDRINGIPLIYSCSVVIYIWF